MFLILEKGNLKTLEDRLEKGKLTKSSFNRWKNERKKEIEKFVSEYGRMPPETRHEMITTLLRELLREVG